MKYQPGLPARNDNISHDRPFREFALLLSGITVFLLAGFWILGFFVDLAVDHLSPDMEAKIFSRTAQWLPKGETDPGQMELQRLADRLGPCIGLTFRPRVVLVDSDAANAMAYPGGQIIVLKGLLKTVSSENGLSFVLAHELAHFKHRDHLRGLGRGIVLTVLSAVLTGSGSDITRALAPSVNLGLAQYSQDREARADQEALEVLRCAYGHVGGAREFFDAVKPDKAGSLTAAGHYFDSHPQAVRRIDALSRLARDLNFPEKEILTLPEVLRDRN